ncbi:MAG: nucleotide exchange factor GrpE [Acidimicrobiia bacterium]|nr:nucleotide exchange factor GrpE [Acidimicrobiia bacterium]
MTEETTDTPANGEAHDPTTVDVAALQQDRDETYDRLLRLTAEFDNYRKRTDRERRDLSDFLAMDVVRDILPVIDDLERAMAAAKDLETNTELAVYHQGITLIHRQLLDQLRKRNVEPLEVVGVAFDPEWHEAVANEPAEGRPDGQITAELRRGYRIGSKLLRPAMVKVAKA